MRRRWGIAALGLVAAALALAVARRPQPAIVAPSPSTPDDAPNVLIVLWDTVRADRLSLYGHDRPTTPALDRFAQDAAVYDLAISPGMWTVPAHGSLFTGLPAATHGAAVGWLWLDDHHTTLAEIFGAAGYRTFAWSSNPYLSDQTNLLQGFADARYTWRGDQAARCAEVTRAKLIPGDRSTEISPAWSPDGHGQGWPKHLVAHKDCAPVAVEELLGWVDQEPDAPFLAYVNLLEAHHPRVPSQASRDAVADPATVAAGLQTDASLFRMMAAMEGRASFAPADLAAMSATYDATLRDLDQATAALFDGLAARGLLDDTIVVVTSDHGENLGERGLFDHRWDLHQTLIHVPLVIRWPERVPARRIAAPVSTEHLLGELLALTGVVGPASPRLGEPARVFSELVAPTPRLPEIRAAFPDLPPKRWRTRYRAVFDGPWELLRGSDGRDELYDVVADPAQAHDQLAAEPHRAEALREAVSGWDRARPKYDPSRRGPGDRPGNPLTADAATADQLRQLGYTAGDPE
jgi:arylsulfatase A-like enzyme